MVREGEITSNRAIKVRLITNPTQEKFFKHNMRVSKAVYNWTVRQMLDDYEKYDKAKTEYLDSLPKTLSKEAYDKAKKDFENTHKKDYVRSERDIRKSLTAIIKEDKEHWGWLGNFDSYALHDTIALDIKNALKKFKNEYGKNKDRVSNKRKKYKERGSKKKLTYPYSYGFPQYKKRCDDTSYHTCVSVNNIDRENHKVKIPKIGWVKYSKHQDIPMFEFPSVNVSNAVISTDGVHFYLSFGYYEPFKPLYTEDSSSIGVDLGMKNVAILSNGHIVPNVADNPKVKKYLKKISRLKRKLSWLQEHSETFYKRKQELKEDEWAKAKWRMDTRQTTKVKRQIKKLQIRLDNYKSNLLHNQCHDIVMTNPTRIVFEKLNIKGMQKNKRTSSKLQQTGMYKFKATLAWHAKKHNIPCAEIDMFYPSSQTCSNCGTKNEKMKNLKIRTFVCPNCGMVMDRDLNAAINIDKQWDSPKTKPFG